MEFVEGILSMRVGTVKGEDIMSPARGDFNWEDGILTSQCLYNTCEKGHPQKDCTCGIYSVLDNGLDELQNYIQGSDHVIFLGWAFSTVHIYEWGLRSGQWVAVGVVNWHGKYSKSISPDNEREAWWDSAYSALEILRNRHVEKPRLYEMDVVKDAIQQQLKMHEEQAMAINQFFGIKQ